MHEDLFLDAVTNGHPNKVAASPKFLFRLALPRVSPIRKQKGRVTIERIRRLGPLIVDEDLVRQLRSLPDGPARRELVDQLMARQQARVALWCLRFSGDPELARDLTQEVLLKAYQNLHRFEGNSKFSTWLFVIARNHCLNSVRAPREQPGPQHVDELLETQAAGGPSAETLLLENASHQLVRRLLQDELDETERQVMVMHYASDMPLASITRILGLANASGAKAFIVSAKRKLTRAISRSPDLRSSRPA